MLGENTVRTIDPRFSNFLVIVVFALLLILDFDFVFVLGLNFGFGLGLGHNSNSNPNPQPSYRLTKPEKKNVAPCFKIMGFLTCYLNGCVPL